jgi:hypothetical protein
MTVYFEGLLSWNTTIVSVHLIKPVLRIRDVYPGALIRIFFISDPGSDFFYSGSRIFFPSQIRFFFIPDPHQRIKVFQPKTLLLSSRIPDPDPDFFTRPRSRGQKGTGSGIRNTVLNI